MFMGGIANSPNNAHVSFSLQSDHLTPCYCEFKGSRLREHGSRYGAAKDPDRDNLLQPKTDGSTRLRVVFLLMTVSGGRKRKTL